MFERFYLVPFD